MEKSKIMFNKNTVNFVLEALGKGVNKDGYVVKNKTNRRVRDYDGYHFKPTDLIGIYKQHYITSDAQLYSIVCKE